MKDWLKRMLKQKQEARATLKEKGTKSDNLDEVRGITSQIEALDSEIRDFEGQLQKLEEEERAAQNNSQQQGDSFRPNENGEQRGTGNNQAVNANLGNAQPQGDTRSVGNFAMGFGGGHSEEARAKEYFEMCEQRGADLKARKSVKFEARELAGLFPSLEKRAVSLGTSNLVAEQKYSDILVPMFPQVSSLVDLVNAIPLKGGEGYTQGFEVSAGEGNYTDTETAVYNEADPIFDNVSIGKANITSYTELTKEARKLPNVDYQNRVAAAVTTSLRKKVAKEILLGTGLVNRLTGIFNAPVNVMPVANVDITIAQIDEDTLDKIVYSYGGDEAVEGGQWLVLNKVDLAAFAAVRSTTGEKLYKIELQGLVGRISSDGSYGVNFVINSAAPALSSASTASGTYTMGYGSPASYEMPIFSDIEVMESLDFKFSSGQMAFRGDIWLGGNVSKYKGFIRVKKG